ncbi:MAG: hypothetical protein IPG50_16205 [Myxococcales bacterium]|nr:hypothetical protein [Myxococcales bacterium]
MANWLIHSDDGVPRGPASAADLARAIRSGILDARQRVARAAAPNDFRPANTFPELATLLAGGGAGADGPEDEAALRTLIASPAEIKALDQAAAAGPASVDEMRSFGRRPPAAAPPSEPPHPADEEEGGERTLITASPFEEGELPEMGSPVHDSFPPPARDLPAARPAAGRRPSLPDHGLPGQGLAGPGPSPATSRRPSMPDYGAGPAPAIHEAQAAPGRSNTRIIQPGPAQSRHRAFLALSFTGGLFFGLIVLGIIYAVSGVR